MGLREEELKAKIAEMEQVVYSTEEVVDVEGVSETPDTEAMTETIVETGEVTGESETPRPNAELEEENWKTKYEDLLLSHKKLRANSDTFKFNSRTQAKQKDERIQELEKTISAMPRVKEDIFADTFTPEETEMLGEKAVAAIKKASETASKSTEERLQKQLDAANKRAAEAEALRSQANVQDASTNFLTKLEIAVPNFKEIDSDKGFERFIYDDDPVNGGQRIKYFKAAENNKDVATVARYMLEYNSLANPVKEDKLASKITPVGTGTTVVPTKEDKTLLTLSGMENFYKDVSRGKYKGKASLQAKHQSMWDSAFEEGRINMMG